MSLYVTKQGGWADMVAGAYKYRLKEDADADCPPDCEVVRADLAGTESGEWPHSDPQNFSLDWTLFWVIRSKKEPKP